MQLKVLLVCFLLFYPVLYAQRSGIWTAFYNRDSTLIGYKDYHGTVQIPAKFTEFTTAMRFKDIIGVSEKSGAAWKSYYINKAGRKFGADSLYITDNTPDCENEGYIRFRDRKTDKIGMFNRHGKTVIPAVYDELSKVRNGMIVGLKGADKRYMHEDREKDGDNYYVWTGGKELLIDTLNKVLSEKFTSHASLNFYSVSHSSKPSADRIRKNFPAADGRYYSFIDFKEEFRHWFSKELLRKLSPEKLTRMSSDSIVWESRNGWAKTHGRTFVRKNYDLLRKSLLDFNNPNAEVALFLQDLNPFIYEGPDFKTYFNNCDEAETWKYPVMSVVFTYRTGNDLAQNHFDFLRTKKGYRLISVTLRTDSLTP